MQAHEPFTLVWEAFLTRLLPLYDEVTLSAIRNLRIADYPVAATYAGLGGLAACALLYAIGVWLRRMPKRVSTQAQQQRIESMRGTAQEWLPYLLILSPTPIGGILVIAAAFFAIRPWKIVLMLVVAEAAFRAAPVL